MYICVFFPSSESNLYILSLGLFVFDIKFIFSSKFLLKTYPKKKTPCIIIHYFYEKLFINKKIQTSLILWRDYVLHGGLPRIFSCKTELGPIVNVLTSSVGSLTNPTRLTNMFISSGIRANERKKLSGYKCPAAMAQKPRFQNSPDTHPKNVLY